MSSHRSMQKWVFAVVPAVLAFPYLGCRESAAKVENLVEKKTTLSVHLVGDPSEEFRKVNLHITQVDVKAQGDWQPLARPGRVFDLQAPGGQEQLIAKGVRLDRGSYEDLRLVVDPARSSVELADGGTRPLALPEALKAGIPLRVTEGPAGDNLFYDLILNIDAGRSIHRREAGGGTHTYTFVPVAALNDRNAMGVLSGRLVDDQNRPLQHVQVLAQDGEDGQGRTLVRTARTGADGTFTIDLLPVRRMYYAVAQPRVGTVAFKAQASPGFKPTRLDRKKTLTFQPFQPAKEAAGPEVTVQIPVDGHQFDVVDLIQELPTGTRTGPFIIRSAQVIATPGGEKGTCRFGPVPEGTYEVRLTRATHAAQQDAPSLHITGRRPVELKAGEPAPKVVF